LNAILDEAEYMNKSFSDATTTLVRIGLSIRQSQRYNEEKLQEEELRILQKGSKP